MNDWKLTDYVWRILEKGVRQFIVGISRSTSIEEQRGFAFGVGASKLPAGDYALAEEGAQRIVYLTNEETGATLIVLPRGV